MEQYTLKLSQGTSYKLYEGTTLMPDAELEALFASNGSAYFVFDFDGSTPSSTTTVQIVDSTDEMIIEKTSVNVRDDRNYKGTWSGTTTFDSFEVLSGKSLDEYQVKFLMSEIKKPVGADRIDSSAVTESKIANSAVTTNKLADGSVTGAANAAVDVTGSKVALSTVGTPNMRDSAITTAKLADDAVTTAKITDANVTSAKLADSAVTTAKIANAAVTSGKIANGAVTAEKLGTGVGETLPVGSEIEYDGSTVPTGWQEINPIKEIDISQYITISTSSVARAKLVKYGKVCFVNIAFNPSSNLTNQVIVRIPTSLGIVPLFTSELVCTVENDIRRALMGTDSGGTTISVSAHTSSANKFVRVFGTIIVS